MWGGEVDRALMKRNQIKTRGLSPGPTGGPVVGFSLLAHPRFPFLVAAYIAATGCRFTMPLCGSKSLRDMKLPPDRLLRPQDPMTGFFENRLESFPDLRENPCPGTTQITRCARNADFHPPSFPIAYLCASVSPFDFPHFFPCCSHAVTHAVNRAVIHAVPMLLLMLLFMLLFFTQNVSNIRQINMIENRPKKIFRIISMRLSPDRRKLQKRCYKHYMNFMRLPRATGVDKSCIKATPIIQIKNQPFVEYPFFGKYRHFEREYHEKNPGGFGNFRFIRPLMFRLCLQPQATAKFAQRAGAKRQGSQNHNQKRCSIFYR